MPQVEWVPTPQQYAEAAIGWPFYLDGRTLENLADLDGERSHIALAGLTRVISEGPESFAAEETILKEQFGRESSLEERLHWWPGGAAIALYNNDLYREKKNLQILQGIESRIQGYQDGSVITELRDYQEIVMGNLHDFIVGPRHLDRALPKGCSFIMPTGEGKTAAFIELIVAAKSKEDRKNPVRSIILEPTRDLMFQTVDAINEWAPDLDVGVAWEKQHQMDKEVVVMVVDTFLLMLESGELQLEDFDLGVIDEAHTVIGPKTRQAIETYFADKRVVACTASPDYDEVKSVREMFPPVFERHLPEALREEKRWLAPVRTGVMQARATSEMVKRALARKQRGKRLTDEEIRKAAEREASIDLALRVIKAELENGIQALGKFAPGGDVEEAKEAARRLNEMEMVDPATGELRKIIAVAVPGTMPIATRREYYRRYNAREIDVLTFVRVLGIGWNSKNAKALIDADPGGSVPKATQEFGRITRPLIGADGREVIARAYNIVDDTAPEGFVTYGQVVGHTTNQPGTIIGVREEDLVDYNLPYLPEDLQALLDELDGVSFEELTGASTSAVAHTIERIGERADQEISLARAALIVGLGDERKIAQLARKHNAPLYMRLRNQYVRLGDLANIIRAEEDLNSRFRPVENNYHLLEDVAAELEVDLAQLERQLRANRVPVVPFMSEEGLPGRYLSREQKLRVQGAVSKSRAKRAQREKPN